ncbi:MAG: cyanophycin synthetase [Actinomycetota bacterium]|nr:cyanophycin synthetase [Actinomycetota bacterium]
MFLNHDNPWTGLIKDICGCRTKEFGYNHDLDYNFKNQSMDSGGCFGFDFCNSKKKMVSVHLTIAGYHNIYNACAAAGVGHYLQVSVEDIQKGLAAAVIEKDRMQILKKGSITVIDDCYNANPLSVACALESLRQIADMKEARSVAVLAGMLELGQDSDKLHYEMGKKIAENNIDLLITFGKMARNINEGYGKDSYYFENKQDCLEAIRGLIKAGDVVLIKGSRANRMEDIIDKI